MNPARGRLQPAKMETSGSLHACHAFNDDGLWRAMLYPSSRCRPEKAKSAVRDGAKNFNRDRTIPMNAAAYDACAGSWNAGTAAGRQDRILSFHIVPDH